MSEGLLDSFWGSLQRAEYRLEAEATDAARSVYRTVYGYKSRVMRVREALADSGPIARQTVTHKLEGINLDAVWDILFSAVRDMALYYGGSVVLGTAVGAGLGSLAGGVGAIPGAAIGFEAGNLLGEWVLMFLGLKMLAEGLVDTIPQALKLYVDAFRIAWGPVEQDRPDAPYSADYHHSEDMAAHRFAEGHVLMIIAILIALVAYLTRGKSEKALLEAINKSERLGSKFADWLEANKGKLMQDERLRPKLRERPEPQEKPAEPLSQRPRVADPQKGSNTTSKPVEEAPSKVADAAPKADQPLLLTYTPTTKTLSQIRSMSGPERWQAGEQYIQELYGSSGQQHFDVPAGDFNGETITGSGGRFVDAPVDTPDGGTFANEVKTYKQWTTVNGQPAQQFVPLSEQIQQQVLKDSWLQQNVSGYQPNWIFLDAPPSPELGQYLTDKNIPYIVYH